MKVTLQIEIEPFVTPNFVVISNKGTKASNETLSIKELDAVTLDELCHQFTTDVFRKAGKDRPPQMARKGE